MHPVTSQFRDRRRSHRFPIRAAASVRTPSGFASTYAVDDMSRDGALLRGGPVLSRGSSLAAVIRRVGCSPMSVSARVVRHLGTNSERPRWAIRFWELSDEAEDAIRDLTTDVLAESPAILVVDRSRAAREELAADIRAAGLLPLSVSTPLEAISLLERHGDRVDSVVVGRNSDPELWLGLLEFVGREYPTVRRVAWANAGRHRAESAPPADREPGPAEAVLFGRWDRAALTRALGLDGARGRTRRA